MVIHASFLISIKKAEVMLNEQSVCYPGHPS